jgi:Uma2 family endonuclease
MTPAPTTRHQRIVREVFSALTAHFRGKTCEPFSSPVDVVFDAHNVVQPDLIVVCDKEKISEANIQGAPDLVVEILSPSTSLKDKREKKAIYERFGVREYLIIHPLDEIVERFLLSDGHYGPEEIFGGAETLPLAIFPELTLRLWEVFGHEGPVKADEG